MSLRKAINAKCADCIYDDCAAGTKLQQITLCSVFDCPLWPVRPTTKSPIPKRVLEYYRIKPDDPCLESILSSAKCLKWPSGGAYSAPQGGSVL